MEPRIEVITPKQLVGKRVRMSLSNDRTAELWKGFMPRRKEVQHTIGTDLFCVQVYDHALDLGSFTVDTVFDKWAAIEVADIETIPHGMETYTLAGGLYAVFLYKGRARDFKDTFYYIFGTWLPNSIYEVDNREHFEILGTRYKNDDPESEEEIWVPIVEKTPNSHN